MSKSVVKTEHRTFTGKQLKKRLADAAANATEVAVLVENFFQGHAKVDSAIVQVVTADTGSASTTVMKLGTDAEGDELIASINLRSTGKTGVGTSFVPVLVTGRHLKMDLTVTGSGKYLSDIADTTKIDIYVTFSDFV